MAGDVGRINNPAEIRRVLDIAEFYRNLKPDRESENEYDAALNSCRSVLTGVLILLSELI